MIKNLYYFFFSLCRKWGVLFPFDFFLEHSLSHLKKVKQVHRFSFSIDFVSKTICFSRSFIVPFFFSCFSQSIQSGTKTFRVFLILQFVHLNMPNAISFYGIFTVIYSQYSKSNQFLDWSNPKNIITSPILFFSPPKVD